MGKVGGRNFGKFMVICQIRQRFPPPKFLSIWYANNFLALVDIKACLYIQLPIYNAVSY